MKDILANVKISKKISILVILFAIGLIAFGIVSLHTLNNLKVGGPIYNEIVTYKDLVADILPPPEYIIESYLICNQMIYEKDKKECDKLINKSNQLYHDYIDRHKLWSDSLPNNNMKEIMVNESYKPAIMFFTIRDKQFIPAIQHGDYEKAKFILNNELKTYYNLHRDAIDKVVDLANNTNTIIEKNSKSSIQQSIIILIVLGSIIIGFVLALSIFISISITTPLNKAISFAKRIAEGDLKFIEEIKTK